MTKPADSGILGRRTTGGDERVEGYQVITIDGVRVGTVAGARGEALLVRCGGWRRRGLRALPVERAVVRDVDRTVLMLASPDELDHVGRRNAGLAAGVGGRGSRSGRRQP
jgi:hypothetical protein